MVLVNGAYDALSWDQLVAGSRFAGWGVGGGLSLSDTVTYGVFISTAPSPLLIRDTPWDKYTINQSQDHTSRM